MNSTTQHSVVFPDLFGKPVLTKFDEPHASSDGGAVLLRAADTRLGLTKRLADCLSDERQAGKIVHGLDELVRQRVFGIACGYPDTNDAARLAHDPIHKLLLGRDPVDGEGLASQPTLSRFENSAGPRDAYRFGKALMDVVVEHHRRRLKGRAVERITIDLDVTDDPTHGGQQLSLFNGFYGTWCYLPLLGFLSFNDEPEQYLFTAVLRNGTAPCKQGTLGILKRVIARIGDLFPHVKILVRLDGGFVAPELLEFLEAAGVKYVVGMAKNAVLQRVVAKRMRGVRKKARRSGRTEHVYGSTRYAARTWPRRRRVIIKAEVTCLEGRTPRDNPRFVVTNLPGTARSIYEKIYCARGEIENRIKELKYGLEIDRTSCTSFWANQFRILMTAAAYTLMQELRRCAAQTSLARAQVQTLRERLLKIGAHMVASVRRLVLHLPQSYPFFEAFRGVALSLGAKSG
jgi:DDE family transposase